MRQPYRDLYALFRHEPEAEAYFNSLPSYAQEQAQRKLSGGRFHGTSA